MIDLKLPNLKLRPSPAYERFARERAREWKRVQRRAWWQDHRHSIVVWTLIVLCLAGMSTAIAMDRRAYQERESALMQEAAYNLARAERFTDLAMRLATTRQGGRISIRISADGPDDAIAQLEAMRDAMVEQRGPVKP